MLSQNPKQADFVLGTCPHCEKVVRVPVTAMTSQSRAQVKCPLCGEAFEIAEVLEELIPSVEVVDEGVVSASTSDKPDRINAIDNPELFHVSKDGYEPKTEKKNGRFVVPELLSKGIKKKKNRKSRRRSRDDKKLAESLAKLRENTASTSVPTTSDLLGQPGASEHQSDGKEDSKRRGSRYTRRRGRESGSQKSERNKRSDNSIGFSGSLRSIKRLVHWVKFKLGMTDNALANAADTELSKRAEVALLGLGALVAIPVVHMVLWWFVGIDPLGLARPTGYVAPFFVPKSMLVQPEETLESETSSDISSENPSVENDPRFTRSEDGKLPTPNFDPDSVHND